MTNDQKNIYNIIAMYKRYTTVSFLEVMTKYSRDEINDIISKLLMTKKIKVEGKGYVATP